MVERVKAIEQTESGLENALKGIRTRKQFVEAFPELEKYAPSEHKSGSMLPAIANVVADLSKLGWPKNKVAAA
jgi:hypothetical protein